MSRFAPPLNGRNGAVKEPATPWGPLDPAPFSQLKLGALDSPGRRPSLAALDAFRALASTIESLGEDAPSRSIALLSAAPGEGRSLSASLLAVAMSELRPPVRILDADPFQDAVTPRQVLRRWRSRERTPGSVGGNGNGAASGPPPPGDDSIALARIPLARHAYPNHSAFLHDVRMALDTELAMGARVLVDVPACSVSSIGFSVAQMVDAAVYVVRGDRASLETHREVLAQAAMLKINVLGILSNEG